MAGSEPKLMECVWLDAWCDATAEVSLKDVHETHKPWTITTIGWLLFQDEAGVSIANEKTGPETFRGRSFVPRGMVKSLKPYRSPRARRKPQRLPECTVGTGSDQTEDPDSQPPR